MSEELVRAVDALGYETPTEIQQKAIPLAMEGRDVMGCAQTGTGKTAAFALPILHRFIGKPPGVLRCLVLTPTRELAVQVADSFRDYSRFLPYQCGTVFGGVEMWHQIAMLRRGVDVLVATPGRLLDHMHRGNVNFESVEFAVLDEADRMLDMGFIDDVQQIMSCLPEKRQTMLFSATLDGEVLKLSKKLLRDPVSVRVSKSAGTTADGVRQTMHMTSPATKRELLKTLIDRHRMHSAIVFVRTKDGADKIAKYLEHNGVNVGALHSNKTQSARLAILEGFKYGRIRILVATDIAARGLDIPKVSHVINFDVPNAPEDYIHRIGRTGRAGETGDAITLATSAERHQLAAIERLIGKPIPMADAPGSGSAPERGRGPERGGRDRGRGADRSERAPERSPARDDAPREPREREPRHSRSPRDRGRDEPRHETSEPRGRERGRDDRAERNETRDAERAPRERTAPPREREPRAPEPRERASAPRSDRASAPQTPEAGRGRTRKRFW